MDLHILVTYLFNCVKTLWSSGRCVWCWIMLKYYS